MIHTAITTATDEVPKMFEPGWEWWAWPIAWLVFLACGLAMGVIVPLFVAAMDSIENTAVRFLAGTAVVIGAVVVIVFGWAGSGILMRHHENGEGAGWTFLGALVVAGISWYWTARITDYRSNGWDYAMQRSMGWYNAAPAIVIGLGAVFNGIAEIITRLAASIPMPVAQFGAIVVVGAIAVGLYASSSSRRY
jgi:hypothetical protein